MKNFVSVLKDLVNIVRDVFIFAILVLLIFLPERLSNTLNDAGFDEVNILGFKWKKTLVEYSDLVEEQKATISSLKKVNEELSAALNQDTNAPLPGDLKTAFDKVQEEAALALETTGKTVAATQTIVDRARNQVLGGNFRYCYQEKTGKVGNDEYLVACHTTLDRCERAKANPNTQSSLCVPLNMDTTRWQPAPGGFLGSLFQYSPTPFGAPFPQIL